LALNVRTLYHNLLNIDPQGDLPQILALLRLFDQGPAATVAASYHRVAGLNNDQLRKLLALQYSAGLLSKSRDDVMSADKDMQDKLAQFFVAQ